MMLQTCQVAHYRTELSLYVTPPPDRSECGTTTMKKSPLTRDEMLALIAKERQSLEDAIGKLGAKEMTLGGVTDADWSVKDLMGHLLAWEQMFLGWYGAGLKGEIPDTPAPGYTWNWESLHKLNDKIYRHYRRVPLAEVQRLFAESYAETIGAIKRMSNDDLNQKGRFAWTGKGTLAGSITANTWRHYRWARTLIVKWRGAQRRNKNVR